MKKHILKKVSLCILSISLIFSNVSVFATETTNENTTKEFQLTLNEQKSDNAILLEWTNVENIQKYQIFQKKPNSTDEYQSISAADLNDPNLHINVLNIYPSKGNNLKEWMETNKYGKNLMSITEVTMDDFNANPNMLKNEDGTWKYDVVFIGCWDNNNRKDIQKNSIPILKQYIESGRGIIFGHDTICSSVNPNFREFQKYINIVVKTDENWRNYNYGGAESVIINKVGLLTNYPWEIGELETELKIPYTHNVGQFAYSDIWIKFSNEDSTYNAYNFYLTTYNNCAMIMTGHSNGQATEDEQKMLANTIFYTYQLTTKNKHLDYSGQDVASPNLPYITIDTDNKKVILNSEDVGTNYSYYVKANLNDNTNLISNTIDTTITTDIKGFYYILDNRAFTNFNDMTIVKYTEKEIDASEINGKAYLHVIAIDNAGNKSSIAHINIDSLPEIQTNPESVTVYGNESRTATFNIKATGDYLTYQWQVNKGEEWEDIPNATNTSYTTKTITSDMNGYKYRCCVANDTSSLYTDEATITIRNTSITIPREIKLNGDIKQGNYEIKISGDLSQKIKVTPEDKIQLTLGTATTYASFKYEDLKGNLSITTGKSGTWIGKTVFKIEYLE